MASPYRHTRFCDENRQNNPVHVGFRSTDEWFTAQRLAKYTLFLSYFAFLTTDKPPYIASFSPRQTGEGI